MRTATPDFIHFTLPSTDDRETREELQTILLTHSALHRTTALRRSLVHVLAALGGCFVACVFFPDAASDSVRQVLLWTWALCGLGTVASAIVEWQLHGDEARLLARNQIFESPREGDGQ